MKILIAVDDSPTSKRAIEFAARMRWPAGSRMIVMSVVPTMASLAAIAPEGGTAVALVDSLRLEHRQAVERAETRLRESGFATEGRIAEGDPREVLVRVAQEERADLLVVGSHGRTGLAKLMLGSVSSHVVAHAPCSVLVIKGAPAARRP